ncbi:glycosyltransferase family 4 protein [Affinirhizobium pseudoryzae]|uniref:glycosyltransferase family 4 protein n=1 Tax=Allorhizobium pseudoryzae TaxID=379684 RepID=UPI0013EDCC52|nr:glycosyltransferase family 4 protein [Allorhizobium pseudoryzae]
MNRHLVFAYPGCLETKTGGYGYDRHLIRDLTDLGWSIQTMSLGSGFPAPSALVLAEAERQLSALADGTLVLIDGLAFGVMADWASREASRLRLVALVHHPLGLETGVTAEQSERLLAGEARALSAVRHVFVTSHATARQVSALLSVPSEKVTAALPGTEPGAPAASGEAQPHILSVGSLTRRKGHDVLLQALSRLTHLAWRATIIGSPDLDPSTARQLAALTEELGLTDRVTLAGERPDVRAEMAKADLFVLASRYEGYGMVFAEALAHGLPIVGCHAGAVPDVVPQDAGRLVGVDDVNALADAIATLVADGELRRQMAAASRRAGLALPRWRDTAITVSNRLEEI